jgi:hypothetical protein
MDSCGVFSWCRWAFVIIRYHNYANRCIRHTNMFSRHPALLKTRLRQLGPATRAYTGWHRSHLRPLLISLLRWLTRTNLLWSVDFILEQVRFALSSSPVFSRTDTVTDSERFYSSLLDLFEDVEERQEVNDLLTWWNSWVPVLGHSFAVAHNVYWLARYSLTIHQCDVLHVRTVLLRWSKPSGRRVRDLHPIPILRSS